MKTGLIILNIAVTLLFARVLFYVSMFSLASKEYACLHWKPHLVEFFFTRLIVEFVVLLLFLGIVALINIIVLRISNIQVKRPVLRIAVYELVFLGILSLIFAFYSTSTL